MQLEVPAPRERFDIVLDDGARIGVRRHGNSEGARLFMSHGNGFAIDGYLPFWQQFLDRYDVILFDFRNHGENEPAKPANHNYEQFARDLERVFQGTTEKIGAKKSAGLFHSMSGRAAMKHALGIGFRWDALVLFDPPNVPPRGHAAYAAMEAFEVRLTAFAKTRRRRFARPADLAADYAASRMGQSWVPGAHQLMARSVLRLDGLGEGGAGQGYVLTCDPELEAAIYAAALTMNLWPKASDFRGPVKLIGADPELKGGPPTGPANRALGTENGYNYDFVPGTGHMLQIEKPQACAGLTEAFLQECGLG